jgi:predicted PurR-regulated permease PerM
MNVNPLKLSPLLHNLLVGACLVIIIAGMRVAAPLISPLLLTLFLAMLLYPVYGWLLHRGIPTWLTVSLMVVGVLLVGAFLLGLLWLSVGQLRSNLFLYASRILDQWARFQEWLALFGIDVPTLLTRELLNRQVLVGTAAGLLATLGSLTSTSFFVLVATVFLLLQINHLSARLDHELGANSFLSTQAIQVAQRVAHFFAIRVRVNLIVAIGITIWMLILGVDLAILWGIVAFFMGFVMYIGLAIAALPPALLALAETGPLWGMLVLFGFLLINVGVENVLAPAMMAQGLNLAPAVALASLLFWSWVLGPLGFILAIPLTVIVVMIVASNPETRWLLALLTMNAQAGAELVPPDELVTDEKRVDDKMVG